MHSEADAAAWAMIAKQQGLVCMVCGKPPALQRREEFYDSGLCRSCAAEIEADSDRRSNGR
jgi:hypothetical protein